MVQTLFRQAQYYLAQTPAIDTGGLPKPAANSTTIATILTIVFAILGGIAVIMVVIGGIKYAGSQGDPAGTAKAKDTILYAIIGVLVAIFATTIVQFTIGKVF